MSKNLWVKNFQEIEIPRSPVDIIQEQCNYLFEMTDGGVIGRITEYNKNEIGGDLYDFCIRTLYNFDSSVSLKKISEESFLYEFYITSIRTPKYKYRVFFIRFNITLYPLAVLLDQDIAQEVGIDSELLIENEGALLDILARILNSGKIESVITSLLALK